MTSTELVPDDSLSGVIVNDPQRLCLYAWGPPCGFSMHHMCIKPLMHADDCQCACWAKEADAPPEMSTFTMDEGYYWTFSDWKPIFD